ncbi:MAG: metallophosphoesterase [Lachnospiraceae bacterium]|nr:metallophosphoesterase [Lachnospiraceae bacterium]
MKRNEKENFLYLILVFSISILFVLVVLFTTSGENRKPDIVEPETIPETIETVPTETEETEAIETEEAYYPAPSYDFQIEDVYVVVPDLEKEYTIAWVSDLHMLSDHESADDITEEALETIEERYEELSITEDGVHGEELLPEIVDYLNYANPDAVIFGGDILDYCSRHQIDLLKTEFDRLRFKPEQMLYLRSDHDCGVWYSGEALSQEEAYKMHKEIDGYDPEQIYIDLDEIRIVGVNLSYKNLSDEDLKYTLAAYETDKPIIAATHVPYYSTTDVTLAEYSQEVRNTLYYWGPVSDYVPDGNTQKLFEKIYAEPSQVVQVLAGHMHAPWDGYINFTTPEHIFSPVFDGVIGMVHVVSEMPDSTDVSGNDGSGDDTSGNDSSGNDASENDHSENDLSSNDVSKNDATRDTDKDTSKSVSDQTIDLRDPSVEDGSDNSSSIKDVIKLDTTP